VGLPVGHHIGGHVVEEQLLLVPRVLASVTFGSCTLGLLGAGVRPPVAGRLAGRGRHRRDEDHQLDGQACADQRRSEPAHRLRDEHDAASRADRGDDGVRVLRQAGRVVVARQVDGDDVMMGGAEEGHDAVPVPRVRTGAWDQHERGHGCGASLCMRTYACVLLDVFRRRRVPELTDRPRRPGGTLRSMTPSLVPLPLYGDESRRGDFPD